MKQLLSIFSLAVLVYLVNSCHHSHPHEEHNRNASTQAPESAVTVDNRRTSAAAEKVNEKVFMCYYGSWAVYRPEPGKFPVEKIDPFLCTHVIYTFTGLGHDNRIRPLDAWNDLRDNYGKGAFERFVGLKKQNPKLKTLIAIGGWNEGSIKYSAMAANPAARQEFVKSCVEFLDKYQFDGLDVDWEYPANRGGKPEDKQNLVHLLRELKEAFAEKNYLLTAAVSAGKWNIDPGYDVPAVSKYLDYINVMCYDYHGGWEDKTGHNAPLFARPDEIGNDALSNVNFSMNYWISQGAPREKLVLGMATYGRSFTLQRDTENGINAKAPQKGQAGPYTREPGSLGYNEICEMQKRQKWTVIRDPFYLAPYAFNGRQWVSYDDVESIRLKTQFLKYMGLGGAMIWSFETDDFNGICGEKYPLMKAIKEELASDKIFLPQPKPLTEPTVTSTTKPSTSPMPSSSTSSSSSSSSVSSSSPVPSSSPSPLPSSSPSSSATSSSTGSSSTSSSSTESSSPSPGSSGNGTPCTAEGWYRDPQDCRKFYRCIPSGMVGKFRLAKFECPANTVFDNDSRICLWPDSVPGCENYYKTSDQGSNTQN